jgi:RNA polymerase sigma-70 factor (ECF subfamily)
MADFLQRIAERRDVEAFRNLFEAYAPRVKAYMLRQGADANTAEELAQETLLAVWRKAGLYSGDKGSATTWIFTIARNIRIDRLRKELTWVPLPDGYEQEPSNEATPDEAIDEAERRSRVQKALAELPPDQHEVVLLSYIDGLSHSEIAERLGLPLGTVKSRMRLAYFKIRGAVEDLK